MFVCLQLAATFQGAATELVLVVPSLELPEGASPVEAVSAPVASRHASLRGHSRIFAGEFVGCLRPS